MNLDQVMRILLATILFCPNSISARTRSNGRNESTVVLEATNIIHGIGHYVGKTLLVRVREDGTVEWEKDLDAFKRERHVKKLSPEDVDSIRGHLNLIDQSLFSANMGPFATYTDTFVELRVHLASNKQAKNFVLQNPWPCSLPSCSQKAKKEMPVEVRALLCEISSLRSSLAREEPLLSCAEPQAQSKR